MFKVLTLVCIVGLTVAAPGNLDFAPLNEFSLKLLDHTFTYQENFGSSNFALSPVSVWNIFALLAEGSSGKTFKELTTELKLPADLRSTQALHSATSRLLRCDHPDVILKNKDAMFSANSLNIHPEFCEAAKSYDTDIYSVDETNLKLLADNINRYICESTDGKITQAVMEESLRNLRLILVDAIYFKANWTRPFDPTQTKQEDFYDYQGKSIGAINMMYHKAPHHLSDIVSIGAQVLEMNYGIHEEFSMLILLPFDGTPLKQMLANLASQPLDWINDLRADKETEIDVYVPRFTVTSQSNLIPPLQYTGIHSIFDMQKAELPGISDSPLYISSVSQSVSLEVSEEGTVAAGSTVVGLEDRFLGNRFEANRNFAFLILERTSNLILFAGVYQQPLLV